MSKIIVSIDFGTCTEKIAEFNDEEAYNTCFPSLEEYAHSRFGELIESIEESVKEPEVKSKYASEVLSIMDSMEDPSYEKAFAFVVTKYPIIDRVKLEKELEKYI
jgi:hypothetical protein